MPSTSKSMSYAWLIAVAAAGCGAPDGAESGSTLGAIRAGDEPSLLDDLDCPIGPIGEIRVEFDCDAITVVTCRELSNVVLEYEDGSRERFEGLDGHHDSFAGTGDNQGKVIARAWIKAGGNLSGEGPGYGTRFESSGDSCDDTDPCADNDPDTVCDDSEVPPPPGDSTGSPCAGKPECSVD